MLVLATGAVPPEKTAPDPKAVVVKVGPLSAVLEDFSREFHHAARADTSTLTPDRAGILRFLRTYENTLLLHAWAMQDSSLMNATDRSTLADGIHQILQDALRDQVLPTYLKADDAVLREVHDRMKTQLHLLSVKVPTLVEVDSVRALLRRGVPFGTVARNWSKDMQSAQRGGDLGWLDAPRFAVDAQKILWTLPVGVDTLIQERQFHSIYRVLERRTAPPPKSFEEERPNILRAINMVELGRAGSQMHEDLMASYHYRVDLEAAEWMRAFLAKETAGARREYDPERDKSYAIIGGPTEGPFWKEAPLTGADAARPVAFIDGDTLPAIEVIDELVYQPTLVWPKFEVVSDVLDLCDSALWDRVQTREAKRLNLERLPAVQRKIMDRRRRSYWKAYRREKIVPVVTPTDDELLSRYSQNPDAFSLPERRRFVALNVPSPEHAQQAIQMLKAGKVPSTIVSALRKPGIQFEATPDTTLGWVPRGRFPDIDPVLFSLKAGEVSDPIPDRGRLAVIRVEQISPAHVQSFLEVKQGVKNRIGAEREERILTDILMKARPMFPIWTDEGMITRMDIDETVFQNRGKGARG